VTARLLRLVALAATLAPGRAERLLARLEGPGSAEAARRAGALARAPRRARLAALAASLLDPGPAPRTLAPLPAHPLLRRLERERRADPAAARTAVRPANRVR
jgi:hypothetical protein